MNKRNIIFLVLMTLTAANTLLPAQEGQEKAAVIEKEINLLKLLEIIPSEESIDYVQNKTQFQLHTLLTEQRHPKTWNLGEKIQDDFEIGLRMLFSVDEDIVKTLESFSQDTSTLENAAQAVAEALLSGNKIYIYGCGATGRLAKQMESTFWRPFWKKVKNQERIWKRIQSHLKTNVENQLIGEMTGADRALISSLEGFEDLLLIGKLQLEDHRIKKGDVVICVTEGGETSSVIGTILAALDQWKKGKAYIPEKSRKKLFFIYNNPDEKLHPFIRSRKVLDEPGITKINLTTGPQGITGSTRMQATTIETFIVGHILQTGVDRTLRSFLSKRDMAKIGFKQEPNIKENLEAFEEILIQIKRNIPDISRFTAMELKTYKRGRYSTYFARDGLITVFIDSTERSPTFRLFPLDTIKEKRRKCWIQVWTQAENLQDAWLAFLGRPFKGLSPSFYRDPFNQEIKDPYLKKAALESLKNAGHDQQNLYDFSYSTSNVKNRGPKAGDLAVVVNITPEESLLKNKDSSFRRFIQLCKQNQASCVLLFITEKSQKDISKLIKRIPGFDPQSQDALIAVNIESQNDPMGVNQQIALKILLNAHSTAVMACLGKVIGNTMTNVSPSNLKLIGRATYLIQSHVNDVLQQPQWVKQYSIKNPISYGEANAVLFEAIHFLKDKKTKAGQTAEVALSIIRILESLRLNEGLSQEKAFDIVNNSGLRTYLANVTNQTQ